MRNFGWFLLVWGGLGVVNQVLMIQSLNTNQPPALPMLGQIDPANVLKISNPAGAGITSPGMLTNVAITGVGWYLRRGAHAA